jgi:hypothetical protein
MDEMTHGPVGVPRMPLYAVEAVMAAVRSHRDNLRGVSLLGVTLQEALRELISDCQAMLDGLK